VKVIGAGLPRTGTMSTQDRASFAASAQRHNEAVRRSVPPERLLVYRVQEGWEPLCAFLGCEVPPVAFAHLNEAGTVGERLRRMFLPTSDRAGWIAAAIAAGALVWWLTR
jgi:hypothetical protein